MLNVSRGNQPFRINLIVRLLAFAKYADGVVLLTPTARIGAITLPGN